MRPSRRLVAALLLLAAPAAAEAQATIVSPAPEAVAVTVYRNSGSSPEPLDLQSLDGYALITETRTVRLPAGESVVRFEGVSGGIVPATAIATGLPGEPGEKNRDARLISAGSLVEAALGRRVHIRRTDRKTGRVIEAEAVIRSGPAGIVLQTRDGFEALRCSGMSETLLYDGVPAGLSAKPTLAITTHSAVPTVAKVRLSYLATGFDWQANYVAEVRPDGRTLDLFAWLTLANANGESFVDAQAMAVAGKPNADEDQETPNAHAPGVSFKCWPQGRTHEIPETRLREPKDIVNELPESFAEQGSIIVTGTRIPQPNLVSASPVTVIATQEELGDLKLYRIPIPVTVAANAQKQVALLVRKNVPYERGYSASIETNQRDPDARPVAVETFVRMRNRRERGLGLPLPEGRLAMFEAAGGGQPLLVSQSRFYESAVGEDVEFYVGFSRDVTIARRILDDDRENREWKDVYYDPHPLHQEVEISNATARPVVVEVLLPAEKPWEVVRPSQKLEVKFNRRMWRARVPANGRARLRFTLRPVPSLVPKRPPDQPGD